jgi:hypothetical protein
MNVSKLKMHWWFSECELMDWGQMVVPWQPWNCFSYRAWTFHVETIKQRRNYRLWFTTTPWSLVHNTMPLAPLSVSQNWPHIQAIANTVDIQCPWHQVMHTKRSSYLAHWSIGQLHLWTNKTKIKKNKMCKKPIIHNKSSFCTFK